MTDKLAGGTVAQIARIIREHHRTLIRQSRFANRPSRTFHHGEEEAAEAIVALITRSNHKATLSVTDAMVEAGLKAWEANYGNHGKTVTAIYTAMEAARPSVTSTADGSLTLDNASVQRLMDYGLLHRLDDGWHVGPWPQSNEREENYLTRAADELATEIAALKPPAELQEWIKQNWANQDIDHASFRTEVALLAERGERHEG